MSGRRAGSWAGILALAAAALAGALAKRPGQPAFDADAFRSAIDARLRETAAGLHTRVTTLAELPRLVAAVSTDARTVHDLTQDELSFRPRAGETIAIAQLPKRVAAAPIMLLLSPEGARPPALDVGGRHLRVEAHRMVISEATKVIPRERADELDGVVAVSWPVDLSELTSRLTAAGAQAELSVAGRLLTIGAAPVTAPARRTELPLPDLADDGLRLSLLAVGPTTRTPYWVGAGLLAILGLALLRGRRSSNAAAFRVPEVWSPASSSGPTTGPRLLHATPAGPAASSMGRIGRYELLKTIGLGGMAQVYLARATGDGGFSKVLALKVLQPDFASQPEVVQHFLDEAHLVARLDHPNIVQTVDLGRAGDDYFIAMEYVDGADLSRLIELGHRQRTPAPLPVTLAILRRICDGLHAAHTARADDDTPLGLVHRDVKSANVFVARSGAVKIGDFGIAKADHASRVSRTEIGLVKGTPGYMAPEHRLGQPIDGRADLYGVGAIAYELLTGAPVNLDLAILAQKGRDGWPHLPALSSLRADVPPQLETVVMKALSYEPAERFADCAALEAALEAVATLTGPPASDKAIASWIRAVLDAGTPVARGAARSSS